MANSDRARADRSPLTHSVDTDGGYWEHADPAPRGPYQGRAEALPHPPPDGSAHRLTSAAGDTAIFVWRHIKPDPGAEATDEPAPEDGIWLPRDRMQRLAYTAQHLGSMGWRYVGPVELTGGDPGVETAATAAQPEAAGERVEEPADDAAAADPSRTSRRRGGE